MVDTTFGPQGWTPERLGSQDGKTFLITGGNSGIGFEATRILLSKGAKVVMLNRSAERSETAVAKLKEEFGAGAQVSFVRMDLASLDSVRNAAVEVLETVPQIDAVICNAAIAQVPSQKLTVDGFESMLGTNHYGHFLLCGMLFERIEASKGRIVVVASLGYKMGIKTIPVATTASILTVSWLILSAFFTVQGTQFGSTELIDVAAPAVLVATLISTLLGWAGLASSKSCSPNGHFQPGPFSL